MNRKAYLKIERLLIKVFMICLFRLSESTIEEHKSTSITPVSRQTKTKAAEKECGVQCDVS